MPTLLSIAGGAALGILSVACAPSSMLLAVDSHLWWNSRDVVKSTRELERAFPDSMTRKTERWHAGRTSPRTSPHAESHTQAGGRSRRAFSVGFVAILSRIPLGRALYKLHFPLFLSLLLRRPSTPGRFCASHRTSTRCAAFDNAVSRPSRLILAYHLFSSLQILEDAPPAQCATLQLPRGIASEARSNRDAAVKNATRVSAPGREPSDIAPLHPHCSIPSAPATVPIQNPLLHKIDSANRSSGRAVGHYLSVSTPHPDPPSTQSSQMSNTRGARAIQRTLATRNAWCTPPD